MLEKNKNNNPKSTIAVCLIGAVVLMSVISILMIESGNSERDVGAAASRVNRLPAHDPIYI